MATPAHRDRRPATAAPVSGKSRGFWRGILLLTVTFGIYALYWHYKAYNELAEEYTVTFPTGWYVASLIPIIGPLARLIFMSNFIDDLNSIRRQMGLGRDITLGGFLAWYILGSFIIIGPFVAYAKLQGSINDIWNGAHASRRAPAPGAGGSPSPGVAGGGAPETIPEPGATTSLGSPAGTGSPAGSSAGGSKASPGPAPSGPSSEARGDPVVLRCPDCGTRIRLEADVPTQVTCPQCGRSEPYQPGA